MITDKKSRRIPDSLVFVERPIKSYFEGRGNGQLPPPPPKKKHMVRKVITYTIGVKDGSLVMIGKPHKVQVEDQ